MNYTPPISIQFIWHFCDKELVTPIIDYCKKKLSRDADKPYLHSLDFPVFTFTSRDENDIPSRINRDAQKTVVFVFISDSVVSDKNWSAYIEELIGYDSVHIVPISLSESSFKLQCIKNINQLRYLDYKSEYKNDDIINKMLFIDISHQIYKYFFNECNKLKLFISHTKKDEKGLETAKEIKRFIENDTKMDNFFDTNNIDTATLFNEEIENNIKESTIIVIHSDSYSSRYWCQKELLSAKINKRPIISVDCLNAIEDRAFPLMCNFPSIRYNENIFEIIELAMLETIRYHYNSLLFSEYKKSGYIPEKCDVFNCIPDSFSINNSTQDIIMYPDPDVYIEEKSCLSKDKVLVTPYMFNSIKADMKNIGISVSEIDSNELIKIGQDITSLKNFSQTIAKKLLFNGAVLVYGGDLRKDGFTQYLFEEAAVVQDTIRTERIFIKDYISWPIYINNNNEFKEWCAKYIGICELNTVSLPDDLKLFTDEKKFILPNTTNNKYLWARSLTNMRERMIDECDARIIAGGRTKKYKGCMPGILEEFKISLEKKRPIYLLGGFGGISSKICNYIINRIADDELTVEWQISNNIDYKELIEKYDSCGIKIDYSFIDDITIDDLNNGLSEDENKRLFTTQFIDEAVLLIIKGLINIWK